MVFLAGIFEHCQSFIERAGFFVDVATAQAKIDAAFINLHCNHRKSSHGGSQWLRAAHAAQSTGQYPAVTGVAVKVCFGNAYKCFVGALHDALGTNVYPRTRCHLAIHHQAFFIELVKMFPVGPVRHQVGISDEHSRGVFVRGEYADRLATLHQQSFVILQTQQYFNNLVVALPVPSCSPYAAVYHQALGVFGHFRIEVVH